MKYDYEEKEKELIKNIKAGKELGWVDPEPGVNFEPYAMSEEEALKELEKLRKKIEKDSPQLFKKYKQLKFLKQKGIKMQGVQCPYCSQVIYSAYWSNSGKEHCIYCQKSFILCRQDGKLIAKTV